jgi:homoserine O-succinyltransferase
MPLVSHNDLPTFNRLRQNGQTILQPTRASQQDIRELHIGLLNMMPDAALEATERQFFQLVGESNPIAQFYVHPFTLDELPRGEKARAHIDKFYEPFDKIREDGLDALIITGANVTHPDLAQEPFWEPLSDVVNWAHENVTSTICSCLATHAVLQHSHKQKRQPLGFKRWGVYPHRVIHRTHPLVHDVNTRFDVPHSRFNHISRNQFEAAGLHVLVESEAAGVHLATSRDGFRVIFFQGHPEYETISLLKEFKREVLRYAAGTRRDYPPFPDNYFLSREQAILNEFRLRLDNALGNDSALPELPEHLITGHLDNTWHDTAEGIIGNWMGLVYQITHRERKLPFMDGIDPDNPLGLDL